MNQYIPYAVGALLLLVIAYTSYILAKRRKIYMQLVPLRQVLCQKKAAIEEDWKQLMFEYRLKQDIAYILPNKSQELEERRTSVLGELDEICQKNLYERFRASYTKAVNKLLLDDKEKRLEIVGPADWPFWLGWKIVYTSLSVLDYLGKLIFDNLVLVVTLLSWSNRRVRLEERLRRFEELEEDGESILSGIRDLERGSRFITQREKERAQETFRRRQAERTAQRNRETLEELKLELESSLRYLTQRQNHHSIDLGEEGITHGLSLLSFSKAEECLNEDIAKLQDKEDNGALPEELIPLYLDLLSDFDVVEVDQDTHVTILEANSTRVIRAEELIRAVSNQLAEIEEFMGVKLESFQELEEAERILRDQAPLHWAKRDWAKLEEDLDKLNGLVESARNVLLTLREWAKLIIPLAQKVVWLNDVRDELEEIHSIEVQTTSRWDRAVSLIDEEVPRLWAKLNLVRLESRVGEIKESVELRQQKLATRAYERAQEMAKRIDVSDKAEEKLLALQARILKGPEEEDRLPFQAPAIHQPRVQLKGDLAVSPLGTTYDRRFEEAFRGTDAIKKERQERGEEEEENSS